MLPQASCFFNAVAGALTAQDRKALVESMWAGAGHLIDKASGQTIPVLPDKVAQAGELLFYVGFLGSKRDGIPTLHYLIPAPDERTAVARAHELYEMQPRRRKGSSVRIMLGKPPPVRQRL
jgi:hypothetical protein